MRGQRILLALLGIAFLVSVVHYTDNYVNYADFPHGGSVPEPSRALVGSSWFLFTAFGVAGLVLFMRRRVVPAAICLTAYSVSGLVGLGHYTVPGATGMVWWRQAHVVVDIVLGVLVLAFALRLVTTRTTEAATAGP